MDNLKALHIGVINEISGYTAKIIINKEEAPKPIYPIDTPMPVYVKDQEENYYLIYEQNLMAPASDLPTLNILGEKGVIVLDPAKHFILKSSLSSFQGNSVLITELSVPQLLSDIYVIPLSEIISCWINYGFNHLKLVVELLGVEKFKIFMRVFTELFREEVMKNLTIQESLLRNLVEIGENKGLNNNPDFLETLKSFMKEETVALILDNSMSEVKALLKEHSLKYGDLICFNEENRLTLTVIKELHLVATLDPLFAIENNIPTTFVQPLKIGMEGTVEGVDGILSRLNSRFDDSFIKIPIAEIPQSQQIYNILLKGNELLHFAIIAISGKGKGNVLKELIFEHQHGLVRHLEEYGDLSNWNRLGIILFDDVGEYVKCLKPRDWGINLGMLVLRFLQDTSQPRIHLIDISGRIEQNNEVEQDFRFIDVHVMKIPLEYIPLNELLRNLEGMAAYGLLIAYLRHYYNQVVPEARPEGFTENRLCLEFVNWFIDVPFPFENRGRDEFGFASASYYTARRELIQFILNNRNYLGIRLQYLDGREHFEYISDQENNPISIEIENDNGNVIRTCLNDEYNLLRLAMHCADNGEVLIIDESSLNPGVKLLIQRILLNHIVDTREQRGFDPHITPCLYIIEEATALLRGKEASQIELFLQMQVRARKFGIGIGLVLQDIKKIDPSLLTQLGWMIALGLPVDSMRSVLFNNVPAELGSYNDYVKYADVGMAVSFQMLLGSNLPLPIKIRHYEKSVKDLLWDEEYMGEGGFDIDTQNHFREIALTLGIPEEVINEILSNPGG